MADSKKTKSKPRKKSAGLRRQVSSPKKSKTKPKNAPKKPGDSKNNSPGGLHAENKLKQKLNELNSIHAFTEKVTSSLSIDSVINAAIGQICTIIHPDMVMAFLLKNDELLLTGSGPEGSKFAHETTPVHHIGECLCGLAARAGKPVYSAHIHQDPRCTWDECKKAGLRSAVALPLKVNGDILGVLLLASGSERDFSKESNFLETITNHLSVGVRNALLHEKIRTNISALETHIANRKKAEEALKVSEKQYKGLIESIEETQFIYTHGIDGVFSYLSPSITKILGYSPDEFSAHYTKYLTNNAANQDVIRHTDLSIQGINQPAYEVEIYHKDGSIRWLEVSEAPVFDNEGKVAAVQGIAHDITERKKAERAILHIAEGVSATVGKQFFYSLSKHLAEVLGADYTYVAEIIPEKPENVRTLSFIADGNVVKNLEVCLTGTPCQTVLEKNICSYTSDVQGLFPNAHIMAEMNVEAYMGTSLMDSSGRMLGLMAVMYRRTIQNTAFAESMLQIFASRASAEIERRQKEKALKAFYQRFRELLNNIVALVYVTDMKSDEILFINQYGRNIWGDVEGQTCWKVLQKDQSGRCSFCTNSRLTDSQGKPSEAVTWEFQNTITNRWYECTDRAITWPDGRIVRMEIAMDITKRKEAEYDLRDSEKRYRRLYSGTPAMMHSIDPDGRLISVSDLWVNTLGYSREEAIGRRSTDFLTESSRRYAVEIVLPAFMKTGVCNDIEYQFVKKNGEVIDTLLSAIAEYDSMGGVLRSLAVIIDITERKRSEKALREARAELEAWNTELETRVKERTVELEKSQNQLIQAEKLSAMGRLSAGLAHELNSPLAGLLPLLEKYRGRAEKDTQESRELALMYQATEHMAKIVSGFSSFARPSRGSFMDLDLNHIIESTLSFTSDPLKKKGVEITTEYADALPVVLGDKTRLQQVILNMITNAGDAMPHGGKLIIKTGLAEDGKSVIMEFIDNGAGIQQEDLGRIFDPFFTTKKPGEGTGLGLSISYGIIKYHGGYISVESGQGKGTRFTVSLPSATIS